MRKAFTVSSTLREQLEQVSENTGLSEAEIMRRGVLEQVDELKHMNKP